MNVSLMFIFSGNFLVPSFSSQKFVGFHVLMATVRDKSVETLL